MTRRHCGIAAVRGGMSGFTKPKSVVLGSAGVPSAHAGRLRSGFGRLWQARGVRH